VEHCGAKKIGARLIEHRDPSLTLSSILNEGRLVPSPTYSHLSPVDSNNAHSSPYSIPQTAIGPTSSGTYQMSYPTLSGSHLQPMPLQASRYQGQTYYPSTSGNGDFGMYQTPGTGSSRTRLSPAPISDQQAYALQYDAQQQHIAAPLLTTSALSTIYDSTIPQYYSVTSEPRWNEQLTPDKVRDEPIGQKRKREKHVMETPSSGTKPLKTPKRAKQQQGDSKASGRAAKRIKVEEGRQQRTQLPTPPSTGRESSHISLPHQLRVQTSEGDTASVEDNIEINSQFRRRGVVVTRNNEEGRKIGLMGVAQGDTEASSSPDEAHISPRMTTIPALSIDASGLATLSTDDVLESEMAWLENAGRTHSPPSSPDMVQLQTPTTTHDAVITEEADSPVTKEQKANKRLQAFTDATKLEEPLICTRIDMFGRVAVKKGAAIRFLGLDGSARIVEETRENDADVWIERPVACSSSAFVKPSWPDDEAPWALAGGSRRERRQREETEKAEILKRYFDAASDESSDEESFTPLRPSRSKGKSVVRLIQSNASDSSDSRRQFPNGWESDNADAKQALLKNIRGRVLPSMLPGKVACACGAETAAGMGSMISCSSCKTWHHLMCCGIQDESQLGPQWWCSRCQAEAIAMSTPAHITPRTAYAQSDERSSAFKGELTTIALAPSPMFVTGATFSQAAASARTPLNRPLNRTVHSPSSRNHRSRILSYGTDMWAYTEDVPPCTPMPTRPDRYSTPRIEDAPFDVTSTPSRHLDFNFSQPSLFSMTPFGGRSRMPSAMLMEGTPWRSRNTCAADGLVPSRHDFFRELNKGAEPASPQMKWPQALLGAHNVSPSPFGHRRSMSGNKMSSMRTSSRSGLGLGMPMEKDE